MLSLWLMELLNRKERYGRNSYELVEKLIRSSKNVCIISPYIDAYYADFIVRHGKGKRIRIISSAISKEARKRISKMSAYKLILTLSALIIANLLIVRLSASIAAYTSFISFLLFLVYIMAYANDRSRKNGIRLKIPKEFVHAKLYIGDNMAIEGSANLTFSGMHKNIEQIRVIDSAEEVSNLRKEFDKLWNRLSD
jgi:phosphatidylserine/phosphatidylglycerophosphate/cardiolipin synthase-like enzyme